MLALAFCDVYHYTVVIKHCLIKLAIERKRFLVTYDFV